MKNEKITKKVCADFEINTGTIVATNAPIKKMIIDGSSIYDIIMQAYTKAAKQTGKKYICRMNGTKLTVKVKGESEPEEGAQSVGVDAKPSDLRHSGIIWQTIH